MNLRLGEEGDTCAARVCKAADKIQGLCREVTVDSPSEQALTRQLGVLATTVQEFDDAHAAVLESVILNEGDVDEEEAADTEMFEVFSEARADAEEVLENRRRVNNPIVNPDN